MHRDPNTKPAPRQHVDDNARRAGEQAWLVLRELIGCDARPPAELDGRARPVIQPHAAS